MRRSGALGNKLVYLAIIVLMLLPLYLLGQPATDQSRDPGGQLTRMRGDFNLAEANLGKIDPASESMKLASLGFRGFAASLLWRKADEYKRAHEWDRLSATLNQISNLQPHYVKVWEHQAHNLAYNVSVEFDDYRQRYAWVKKGTDYLTEGVERNKRAPRLVWYTGWFYGQKLGMSDEKTQFRELFRADEPFHAVLKDQDIEVDSPDAKGPDGRPDNWLVGRLWLNRGYELVDGGLPLTGKSAVTFFEIGPKWRIQHATAIQTEGVLDDRAKGAWERAADDWYGYGTRALPTTDASTVQLAKIGDLFQRRGELVAQFEAVAGDTLRRLKNERESSLSPMQRYAISLDPRERTRDEMIAAMEAETVLNVDFIAAAKAAPDEQQLRAIEIAAQIADVDARIGKSNIYRNQMNYDYWALRCEAEQDDLMLDARRGLYDAKEAYNQSDLDGEIAKYEQAFAKWREIYDKYPKLVEDTTADEVFVAINRYRVATDQASLPEDFPLRIFYDFYSSEEAEHTADEYARLLENKGEPKAGIVPKVDFKRPYIGGDRDKNAEQTTLPNTGFQILPRNAAIMEAIEREESGNVDKPTEDTPAGDTPATDAPATVTPATDAPAADAPAADIPTTDTPTTDTPAADSPATDTPTTDAPSTDAPAGDGGK